MAFTVLITRNTNNELFITDSDGNIEEWGEMPWDEEISFKMIDRINSILRGRE